MADVTATSAAQDRGRQPRGRQPFRPDRVYLGWQYTLLSPDPGPPPRRPTPPEQEQLNPEWVAAQRRDENLLNRPLKIAFCVAFLLAAGPRGAWIGGPGLSGGGEATVVDLAEGAAAAGLSPAAQRSGIDPLVWVLPADLPRLDVAAGLGCAELADVLSLVVNVSEEHASTRDLSYDNAILERVLKMFGGRATIAQVNAALRALAQVGDPRDDLRLGLIDARQLERIGTMFRRGAADRGVSERAWALESQLRKLENLGSPPTPV